MHTINTENRQQTEEEPDGTGDMKSDDVLASRLPVMGGGQLNLTMPSIPMLQFSTEWAVRNKACALRGALVGHPLTMHEGILGGGR